MVVEDFPNQESLSYAPTAIDGYQFSLVAFTTFLNEFLRFFVNFGGKKIAYLWLKYLIVSTLISIIKVADVRIF